MKNKITENALDLDSFEIRKVRGKYLPTTSSIEARYRIENDNVELLGYVEKTKWEDFSKRVRKTFTNALDFARPEREIFNKECERIAEVIYSKYADNNGYISYDKIKDISSVHKAIGHKWLGSSKQYEFALNLKYGRKEGALAFDALSFFSRVTPEVNHFYEVEANFREKQNSIFLSTTSKMREILDIPQVKKNSCGVEHFNDKDTIRHSKEDTTLWSGYDSDREQMDLITEAELLTVFLFDNLDASQMDDNTKAELAIFSARKVAEKRLSKKASNIRLFSNRGSSKIVKNAKPTDSFNRLMKVFDKYIIEGVPYTNTNNTETQELNKDIDTLKKNIRAKSGEENPFINVKRTFTSPKKRGGGDSAFKALTKKNMEELGLDEDDFGNDW